MKRNNKKAAGDWVRQLYECSSPSIREIHDKTYVARRYHDVCPVTKRMPFSALFYGPGEHLPKLSPIQSDSGLSEVDLWQQSSTASKIDPANTGTAYTRVTLLNVYDETPEVKTFRFGKLEGQGFDYLPGQYITLVVLIDGREYKRSYSLASNPARSGNLEITVKQDPNGGVVSNWLNDHLKIGDTLSLKGPFGKFSCVKQPCEKMLFLVAGSGIVPIMSMLRWLADTDASTDVLCLLSFRTSEDIIYRDELKLIAARHKNIRLAITLTTETMPPSQGAGITGRINEQMIAELVPDLPERTVYLCGPDAFMAACKKNLLKLNLPPEQLFYESFAINSPKVKSEPACSAQAAESQTGHYEVRFARSDKTIVADGRLTLLELVEKSGILVAHDCRIGECGECMIKCLQGKIEMTDQAEIDEHNRKRGWVYACCAYPSSDVILDI